MTAARPQPASTGNEARPLVQPAGLFLRTVAACYDLLLVAGILMASSFVLIAARGGSAVPIGSLTYRLFLLAQVATFYIYFWSRGGQTLGMRSWRIRVERSDGRPLGVVRAGARFIAALVSIGVVGLGFLWIALDPQRRAWHDRLTGTRIVRI